MRILKIEKKNDKSQQYQQIFILFMFTTSNTKESLGRNLTSKQFSLFFIRKLELNCENLPEISTIISTISISTIENHTISNI